MSKNKILLKIATIEKSTTGNTIIKIYETLEQFCERTNVDIEFMKQRIIEKPFYNYGQKTVVNVYDFLFYFFDIDNWQSPYKTIKK